MKHLTWKKAGLFLASAVFAAFGLRFGGPVVLGLLSMVLSLAFWRLLMEECEDESKDR